MSEKLKLLIVEDDEVDILTIKRSLNVAGTQTDIQVAQEYNSAMEKIRNGEFDCIFLDYLLPGKDGLDLLKEIRALGFRSPIVVITSQGDEQIAVQMMKAGATDYIPKSLLTPEGLSQSLRNALRLTEVEKGRQNTERALKEKETQLKAIIEYSPIIFFVVNSEGRFTVSEGKGLSLLQRKPGELVGVSIYELYKDNPVIASNFEAAFSGKEFVATEKYNDLWFETRYTPFFDKNNTLEGILGVSTDVSLRKHAEDEVHQAHANTTALVENTQAGIWSVDRDYKLIHFNSVVQNEFHLTFGSNVHVGAKILDVVPPEVAKIWEPLFEKALKGEKVLDNHHYEVDDLGFDLEISFNPIWSIDNKVTGVSVFAWNVSEYKRTQQELTLAKELAEKAVKAKQDFLANMSHEIRTPMNAILGFAKLLEKTPLNEEQQHFLDAINSSGETLLVIINDILDLSKIEAGKLSFEQKDLSLKDKLARLIEIFKPKANEKGLKLNTEVSPEIPEALIGDPVRLNQILINLVGNALKFTEQGSVTISAVLLEQVKDKYNVEFRVTDTGIGIPKDKQRAIFRSFDQASTDTTRKYGGTGLGLTICKRLIELQGGKISLESEPDKGSSFIFNLKFKRGDLTRMRDLSNRKKQKVDIEKRPDIRILLVEDNPMNQILAKRVLTGFGFQVELAQNGKIALEAVESSEFDCILMDIQMPVMDGYEASRQIRKLSGPKGNTPIIALTAHAIPEEMEKCKTAGMNEFATKPFDPDLLYQTIVSQTDSNGKKSNKNIEEPEKQGLMDGYQYLDLTYIDSLADGSDDFKKELIQLFLDNIPVSVAKISNNFQAKNWNEVYLAAHTIKPSFIMFHIKNSEELLNNILNRSKDLDQPETLGPSIEKLEAITQNALKELEIELKQMA